MQRTTQTPDDIGSSSQVEAAESESESVRTQASVLDYVSSAQAGTSMVLLVLQGTLKKGAHFATGKVWGYVRTLRNEVRALLSCIKIIPSHGYTMVHAAAGCFELHS